MTDAAHVRRLTGLLFAGWSALAAAEPVPSLPVLATLGPARLEVGTPPENAPDLRDQSFQLFIDPVQRVLENNEMRLQDGATGRVLWRAAEHELIGGTSFALSRSHRAGHRWVSWDAELKSPRSRLIVIDLQRKQVDWDTVIPLPINPFANTELSPDGRIFAFTDTKTLGGASALKEFNQQAVYFFDFDRRVQLPTALFTRRNNESPHITSLAALSDGRFVIRLGRGELAFWDTRSGRFLSSTSIMPTGNEALDLAVANNGRGVALVVATVTGNGHAQREARYYEADGRLSRVLVLSEDDRFKSATMISHDERYVVLYDNATIGVWDLHENRLLNLDGKTRIKVQAAYTEFSRDSRMLAIDTGNAEDLVMYELPTGRKRSELPGVSQRYLSPDLRWVFRRRDQTLTIHSTNTGRIVQHWRLAGDAALRWSEDSRALEYGEMRGATPVIRRVELNLPAHPEQAPALAALPPGPARELRFTADGRALLARYDQGAARWDLKTGVAVDGRHRQGWHGQEHYPSSRNGWLVVDDSGRELEIVDMMTGKTVRTAPTNGLDSALLLRRYAQDVDTGEYYLLTREGVERYTADGVKIQMIALSPPAPALIAARGGSIVLLTEDGQARVLQPARSSPGEATAYTTLYQSRLPRIAPCPGCDSRFEHLTLLPGGRYLNMGAATACTNLSSPSAVFDLRDGAVVTRGPLVAPVPARRLRAVVAAASGRELQVWELAHRKVEKRFPLDTADDGLPPPRCQAALSDDGRVLAMAHGANRVQVWDLDTMRLIGEAPVSAPVSAVAISSDNRRLAVASEDERITLLALPGP